MASSDRCRPTASICSACEPAPPLPSAHSGCKVDLNICEDIVSSIDLPRFDNSAMDGHAVRAEDVAEASQDAPLSLPVVGEIAAGKAATHRLSPGLR